MTISFMLFNADSVSFYLIVTLSRLLQEYPVYMSQKYTTVVIPYQTRYMQSIRHVRTYLWCGSLPNFLGIKSKWRSHIFFSQPTNSQPYHQDRATTHHLLSTSDQSTNSASIVELGIYSPTSLFD